ncbi:energy-coupling factor ABC transporter substrate-binding protein [Desulfosporosinus sp. BG]|uniref:energy-coupling factor ABC transporter substrate-binding protein n=1 Tax=Desulfosporosinus sp. BG TaxID=1633135 RepID=UPI00083B27A6|nr:energy-coupling factor ABC transporter substrate-binding protein [Desulfosporosinus sp. BG]ODA42090.1 Additional substrate-specific component CbiN of cobalt ECF transporter [Desulfosporosinus sp. BG]
MKPIAKNGILLVIVVVLAFAPLFVAHNGEFAGADDQAEQAISSINANYEPWFKPLWEPPSGEVESFLFALQAALGSGFVFYYLGYSKGRYNESKKSQAG